MGGQGKGPANPDPIAAHPTCRARLRIGERPAPEEPCRFGAGVSQDHPPEPADWDQHGLLPVNLEQKSIPETNLARNGSVTAGATLAECARPRAQQSPITRTC